MTLAPEIIEQAGQTIAREVSPITDLRSNEHYRRTVSGNVPTKSQGRLMG
ncbi:MAG TPA: hypothetical protein VF762_19945 [Blastocatellia bacterium]|jgi:xanthine dehydrogenase iron-sulfur cluster and FAD-binding subunit A